MNPEGRTADLLAWVTLASSDMTSFANAELAVIAGEVNRQETQCGQAPAGGELVLRCLLFPAIPSPSPSPLPSPMMGTVMEMADIVANARAMPVAMKAPVAVQQEGLGDLKLYRAEVWDSKVSEVRQLRRTRNRKEERLGLPLPGGPATVFEPHGDALLLSGKGGLPGRAEGEDVEIILRSSTQVSVSAQILRRDETSQTVEVAVRNARRVPIRFEARLTTGGATAIRSASAPLRRKDGRSIWEVIIPENSSVFLNYKLFDLD